MANLLQNEQSAQELQAQSGALYCARGRIFEHITKFHPELTAFRRDLHAHPELGFEEVYTSQRVIDALKVCGVDEIHTGIGKTGIVALVHGKTNSTKKIQKNKAIALRADMDALPLVECNNFAHVSKTQGLMHACGHDGHVTMLMGAARYLAQTRQFEGTAVLVFQPGEEGYAGAKAMIDDGLFERFPVKEAYAMHNWPTLKPGTIGLNSGAMMAAADRVTIEVYGRGGHGAHPYNAVDTVLVCAHIITAVQSIVARNVRPIDSAVISLCAVQTGDVGAMSVMPEKATIVGTVRTFKKCVQDMVEQRLNEVCMSIASAFGAKAVVKFDRLYPATNNTAPQACFAADVAAGLVGESNVIRDMEPSMGAEDFSFMLEAVPGAYLRIGNGDDKGAKAGSFLHSTYYDFNDEILPLGSALFASLIEKALPLSI